MNEDTNYINVGGEPPDEPMPTETWAGDKRVADAIEAFLNEPDEMVTVRAIDVLTVLRALDGAVDDYAYWRPGELAARVTLYLALHGTAGDPLTDEHVGRISDEEVLGHDSP